MIQRYSAEIWNGIASMLERDHGRYVLYEDHLAALAEKDEWIKTQDAIYQQALNRIGRLEDQLAEKDKEIARWKAVAPDRCNLEYILALEKQIASLKVEVERQKKTIFGLMGKA